MLRMGQAQVIRHKHFVEGVPIRRIAREMRVSRNTVSHLTFFGQGFSRRMVFKFHEIGRCA